VNPAPNVIVTDPLPLGCDVFGVIFQNVATDHGSCSEAGGTVSCNLGTLNPGESAIVTITVEACGPEADGTRHAIENIVTVTAGDLGFLGVITKTAQDDTSIRGILAFGSGCGSSLNGGAAPLGVKSAYAMAGILLLGGLWGWRRRVRQGK
jgi:MYXO-CTERM domain-containing protein